METMQLHEFLSKLAKGKIEQRTIIKQKPNITYILLNKHLHYAPKECSNVAFYVPELNDAVELYLPKETEETILTCKGHELINFIKNNTIKNSDLIVDEKNKTVSIILNNKLYSDGICWCDKTNDWGYAKILPYSEKIFTVKHNKILKY